MYKKILYLSVLVFGLGQSSLGFADELANGNDLSADSSVGVDSTPVYNPGIYLGGQFGTTNLHYQGSGYAPGSPYRYDNKYKFAARGYVGYAFSQFISAELGYDYYGYPNFTGKDNNTQNVLQHGLDLVVKASLPLDYGFGLYAKAGLAWVHRSALHGNKDTFPNKDANSKFTPVGALGINYWFAPHIALDLGWTKTMSIGGLPTIDLITLGLVYKINI